jgi:hypothetical protein
LLSEAAYAVVATTPLAHEPRRIAKLEGKFSLPIGPGRSEGRLYELRSRGLGARRRGGVGGQLSDYTSSSLRSRIDWKERRAKRKGGAAPAQASSRHDYDGSSEWKWEDEGESESESENENESESESENECDNQEQQRPRRQRSDKRKGRRRGSSGPTGGPRPGKWFAAEMPKGQRTTHNVEFTIEEDDTNGPPWNMPHSAYVEQRYVLHAKIRRKEGRSLLLGALEPSADSSPVVFVAPSATSAVLAT